MYQFSKEELSKIYDIVNDKKLKGKIIAIVEYDESINLLINDITRHWFILDNRKQIESVLGHTIKKVNYDNKPLIVESGHMSDYNYHWHFLDMEFDKLIKKSNATWDIEYAYIRLKEDSGMTELKDKKSLNWIYLWLSDIWQPKDEIRHLIKRLWEAWVYDNLEWEDDEKKRRVSLLINSEKKLCLLLLNNDKEMKWYGWHYFTISDDRKRIIDIVVKKWYYENNIWEAIDNIIETKETDEEDDYDMV